MLKNSLLHAMASALLLVGCAGSAQFHGSASVSTPDLVYVSPGVQVIADHREPIFYSDSYYWRYNGNVWYRSSNHTRGWVRYQAPVAILRIERPSAYVHYRGSARASNGPATREERKERKAAQKEERKELKNDRKDTKKDRK
jgi:hypothetical protein